MRRRLPEGTDITQRSREIAHQRGLYPEPSSPGRAANMRAIRRRDTKPEQALASALHRRGYRFRRDYPMRVGHVTIRPDIAFTRKRIAIFIDGCFWHGCPIHGHKPKANQWYWSPKLERNIARDQRNRDLLEEEGWRVLRLWEHIPLEEQVEAARTLLDTELS